MASESIADIEAAVAREAVTERHATGNAAAMREALEKASLFLHKHNMGTVCLPDGSILPCWKVAEIVDAALAAPPRNCDVGTAEEQYRRHDKFCNAVRNGMDGYHCDDAPRCVFCFAKWAQMPYEEGGAK